MTKITTDSDPQAGQTVSKVVDECALLVEGFSASRDGTVFALVVEEAVTLVVIPEVDTRSITTWLRGALIQFHLASLSLQPDPA